MPEITLSGYINQKWHFLLKGRQLIQILIVKFSVNLSIYTQISLMCETLQWYFGCVFMVLVKYFGIAKGNVFLVKVAHVFTLLFKYTSCGLIDF